MTAPAGVSASEWATAQSIARTDRLRLAQLVRSGTVMVVRGERNRLVLPSETPRVNLAIRPRRKRK